VTLSGLPWVARNRSSALSKRRGVLGSLFPGAADALDGVNHIVDLFGVGEAPGVDSGVAHPPGFIGLGLVFKGDMSILSRTAEEDLDRAVHVQVRPAAAFLVKALSNFAPSLVPRPVQASQPILA
jgi:hypothetical protein